MSESELGSVERPSRERMIIIGVFSFVIGVLATAATGAEPLVGIIFYSSGVAFFGLVLATEEGRDELRKIWKKSINENSREELEINDDSKPTKICSECGWKNPKDNEYCNDCGFSFSTMKESDE